MVRRSEFDSCVSDGWSDTRPSEETAVFTESHRHAPGKMSGPRRAPSAFCSLTASGLPPHGRAARSLPLSEKRIFPYYWKLI
jgi:hypothetical protein